MVELSYQALRENINMKKSIKCILPLLVLSILLLSASSNAGQFKVTRVTDGDTIKVRGASSEATIRLVGIDAPETSKSKREPGQPYSQQSMKYLAGMVLNKSVEVREYGRDQYGRVLGVVFLDGQNINLEVVKVGLAEVYRGKPPRGFELAAYQGAERIAKEANRGMWVQGKKYISPYEWRKKQRGGQHGN